MNPLDENRDEEQIEAILSAAARDAAPPDVAFLARLRQQSAEVFEITSQSTPVRERGRFMSARTLRLLAACAAALLVAGPSLLWWLFVRDANPSLARVLQDSARGLHGRLLRDGKIYEVWTDAPGRLRRDDPDGTYQIAAEGRLWRIDEKANRATSEKSPYHRDGAAVSLDLFALLGLPAEPEPARLADTRPVANTDEEGIEYLVYHLEVAADEGAIEIEALVDRRTHRLHRLQAKEQRDGQVRPLAELNVLAYSPEVPEEKFVVRDTLTEDGRVGKIADVQGVVTLKPVMRQRWTPVSTHLILKPGDWLRTDRRGANAADVRLVKRTRLILGPGSLVEIIKPDQVRLHEGEVEIAVPADAKLELLGPGEKSIAIKGTKRYRVEKDFLVAVREEPRWLKAFKGKTSDESLGSLIARVDGRNVPLTVGYHKVTVDVRDQIARTEIEESFVNRTDGVLEGVFHFPLPAGASVSGFGMWIGDKLVEADVVEKQRAREIYETILQEKRDPGLLEWSGGNIFKARVYPIPGHSEKRIKISYTQVLPLKGGQYRYSYGLQSDLLQLHPLRELAIDVKINSATPLKNVTCPTHPTRLDRTAHAAHVEFTAQEYSPTRDFEVVIEPDGKQSNVVLIPHRRGDDGYFMLQLTPPAGGDVEREVLPDGPPLRLVLLADTSASMDAQQRSAQAYFLSALLSCLTPKDTVNLAVCDVECDWVFEKPVPATPSNLLAVRQFLARRTSLGWTDLDKAFASALKQCEPNTHVVYVGDGITTTGDADPVAFTKRLHRLYQEAGKVGTFHAVSPGSSYEAGVLKAIASLGGGSVRHVGGEQPPPAVALELLGEITQPVLRDLKVEFRGLRTARVYPEELPNLPPGSQQIVLGRYLPEGRDRTGEAIITGTRDGKPVRFSTSIALKDAEHGNSFVPRLWARMHLDHLLEQGASQAIHDEIIALSEEYQIITPYTSLLVLESDADRERFAVKRTFRMRDGEKFFAEGRDNANYELKQQQMKRAAAWRLGLHRRVLKQLAMLGRDARWLPKGERDELPTSEAASPLSGAYLPYNFSGGVGGASGAAPSGELGFELLDSETKLGEVSRDAGKPAGMPPLDIPEANEPEEAGESGKDKDAKSEPEPLPREEAKEAEIDLRDIGRPVDRLEDALVDEQFGFSALSGAGGPLTAAGRPWVVGLTLRSPLRSSRQAQWRTSLFPELPPTAQKAKPPRSAWPEEARVLSRSLLRSDKLAKLAGGIEIVQKNDTFDVRWDELSAHLRLTALLSAGAWLTLQEGDQQAALINWCDGRERGVFSRPFQLGSVRAAVPQDLPVPPLDLNDYSLSSLERAYEHFTVTIEHPQVGRVSLVLKHPSNPEYETRLVIDTNRHVLLESERWMNGKRMSRTRYDDFVEVGGIWWAGTVVTTDEQARISSRLTRTIKALAADALAGRMRTELTGRETVQFLHLPMKSIKEAKQAVAAGKASFDDRFALLRYYAGLQQWTRANEQMRKCAELAAGKRGVRWLSSALLLASRRHEELRQRLLEDSQRVAEAKPPYGDALDQFVLAEHISNQAVQVLQGNEMLVLLDQLRPFYAQQLPHRESMKRWMQHRLGALQQAGQTEEALRLQKQLAVDFPRDYSLQQQYAQALASAGDYPAAYGWLKGVLNAKARWLPHEAESLRSTYAQLLEGQGRFPELVDYLADWVKDNPESFTPYNQYISALIRGDQMDKADTLLVKWLREAQASGELSAATLARAHAAVAQAIGQGHNLYNNNGIEDRRLKLLADAALTFVRREATFALADQILSSGQFEQSDEYPRVRKALLVELTAHLDRLAPGRIQHYLHWIGAGTADAWKQIGDALLKQWTSETDAEKKHQLGRALVQVLNKQENPSSLIAFLHTQWEKGPASYRTAYANELFEALLSPPWSAEYEDEAFALLGKLADGEDEGQRLRAQVAALYRLSDRMIESCRAAKMKLLKNPEKLTRIELRKLREEELRKARLGFAERLRRAIDKERGPLASWLKIERAYLLASLDQNLKEVAAECWAILGDEPPKTREVETEPDVAGQLDDILRERCLMTLMNLAARKGADPALTARLEKYLDRGIASEEDGTRWKHLKYALLIAQDRPKELEKALGEWVRAGDADNHWRQSLAFVLAEQGRIPEAIKLLEAIEADDELGAAAYRTLADWYLASNRREQYERARRAAYKNEDEWRLYQAINARLYRQSRSGQQAAPTVDEDVLRMFAVLLEKASDPRQHLGLLQQFYQATHDFRLLAGLADAVVGHTAEGIYPFLERMQSLMAEVGDEATVDELVAYIPKVRKREKTAVDRRALDLLECLIERRAAELKNQPGSHAEAALAALKRAFKGEWAPGEPRLMADFLAVMGVVPQAPLAKEQLRQLEELHRREARGSFDRLHVARRFAETLHAQRRVSDAVAVLQAALNEYQETHHGILPPTANDALGTLLTFLEGARHFDRGEKVLLDQLHHPVHEQQRFWLTLRLDQLYHNALSSDGEASLGAGTKLYRALQRKLRDELANFDPEQRRRTIEHLCGVYATAHAKKLDGVGDDLRAFALQQLPGLLKQQTVNYQNVVGTVAQTVHNLLGPRDGVEFLLTQIGREPAWFRINNQDGWSQFSYTIGQWKEEAKDIGDLDKPLLKLVLTELRRDLETRQYRNRVLYHRNYGHVWAAKEADFAAVAEEVLAKQPRSGAAARYIGDYFHDGLNHYGRAIEILLAAHKAGILDDDGQSRLVDYLQWRNRHAEAVPLLEALMKRRPTMLHDRGRLMIAYYHTNRPKDLLTLVKETDAFFHAKGLWGENVLLTLASGCLETQLYTQSVAYFNELIPLHQRTQPRRGMDKGTLSNYYGQLARAYAGLGKTSEAVDAASGGIVSWGPSHRNRTQAIESLKQVLREAPDLDGYVLAHDNQTAASGLDSAILRKTLGQVYLEKNAPAKAIPQLQQAITLQPNDMETHRLLIDCFDKQGDKPKAILALLRAAETSRRDLKLYQDLGKRLQDQPKEAERAYTSVVEVMPHESEGHALLAEVRQQQDRWTEAATQWEQVARIRALEPTGLLKLAAVRVHLRQWDEAERTLRKVASRSWPPRFGDVRQQVRELEDKIKSGRRN